MIINIKQKEIKIEPRIKLNYNSSIQFLISFDIQIHITFFDDFQDIDLHFTWEKLQKQIA